MGFTGCLSPQNKWSNLFLSRWEHWCSGTSRCNGDLDDGNRKYILHLSTLLDTRPKMWQADPYSPKPLRQQRGLNAFFQNIDLADSSRRGANKSWRLQFQIYFSYQAPLCSTSGRGPSCDWYRMENPWKSLPAFCTMGGSFLDDERPLGEIW